MRETSEAEDLNTLVLVIVSFAFCKKLHLGREQKCLLPISMLVWNRANVHEDLMTKARKRYGFKNSCHRRDSGVAGHIKKVRSEILRQNSK